MGRSLTAAKSAPDALLAREDGVLVAIYLARTSGDAAAGRHVNTDDFHQVIEVDGLGQACAGLELSRFHEVFHPGDDHDRYPRKLAVLPL